VAPRVEFEVSSDLGRKHVPCWNSLFLTSGDLEVLVNLPEVAVIRVGTLELLAGELEDVRLDIDVTVVGVVLRVGREVCLAVVGIVVVVHC